MLEGPSGTLVPTPNSLAEEHLTSRAEMSLPLLYEVSKVARDGCVMLLKLGGLLGSTPSPGQVHLTEIPAQ